MQKNPTKNKKSQIKISVSKHNTTLSLIDIGVWSPLPKHTSSLTTARPDGDLYVLSTSASVFDIYDKLFLSLGCELCDCQCYSVLAKQFETIKLIDELKVSLCCGIADAWTSAFQWSAKLVIKKYQRDFPAFITCENLTSKTRQQQSVWTWLQCSELHEKKKGHIWQIRMWTIPRWWPQS